MTGNSVISRIRKFLAVSYGEVVFGMSDGMISIPGFVPGVAAGANSADAVVLAGRLSNPSVLISKRIHLLSLVWRQQSPVLRKLSHRKPDRLPILSGSSFQTCLPVLLRLFPSFCFPCIPPGSYVSRSLQYFCSPRGSEVPESVTAPPSGRYLKLWELPLQHLLPMYWQGSFSHKP